MRPSAKNYPLNIKLPKIVFAFTSYFGLRKKRVYDVWYSEYLDHLRALGWIDERQESSPWAGGFITHHGNYTRAEVFPNLPLWLHGDLKEQPSNSSWGNLLPVIRNSFREVLARHPDLDYLITLSDTSLPLRSIKSIWASISADRRTYADVRCVHHAEGVPKTHQFLMFRRDHLESLVDPTSTGDWDSPRAWASDDGWIQGECGLAASDEFYQAKALFTGGNRTWYRGFPTRFPKYYINESEKWSSFHSYYDKLSNINSIFSLGTRSFATWWSEDEGLNTNVLGRDWTPVGLCNDYSHPTSFDLLNGAYLQMAAATDSTWFFRKITSNTTVVNCNGFYQLGRFHTEERKNPIAKWLYAGSHFATLKTHRVCRLSQFLIKLWSHPF